MSENLTREDIIEWIYGRIDIDFYDSADDGDAAVFECAVRGALSAKELLAFAADPNCSGRLYCAGLLSQSFLRMFRSGVKLPFHFSRFLGIMSRENYRDELMARADEVYELCVILDSMRIINDPAVYSLYKQILDFRRDEGESSIRLYYECSSKLDLSLFE